jgi:alcohol dehydrogenase (cytochrome c)
MMFLHAIRRHRGTLRRLAVALAVGLTVPTVAPVARAGQVTDQTLLNAANDSNNWITSGRDYASTRFSPLTQIAPANVKRLVPKWSFSLGTLDAQQTTPLANDGVLYLTAAHSRIYAVDAHNGRQIWQYVHPVEEGTPRKMCCDAGNRGAALYGDKVYFTTNDAHVVALRAATGEVVWDTTVGDWHLGQTMTVAPLVVKGKILVGLSGAEFPTRLWVEALDAETGKEVWRRYTIPGEGEKGVETWGSVDAALHGGGSTWITGSYDPQLDTVFWGTGNPNPDWDGVPRPGDNLYSNSTLALNPDTGELKYYFQYTPHDVWDFDGVNEVILADLGDKKLWLHGDRNGFLYAINRTNGEFVYGSPISKVNWTTGFTETGRPIVNEAKLHAYGKEATDVCPASEGGKWWNPASYDPQRKLVIVPSREICADILSAPEKEVDGHTRWGVERLGWNKGHGQLVAFDAATGTKKWTVDAPSPFMGGVATTASGLTFTGTPEGEFKAYETATGKELWSYQTGSGIVGSPSTFVVDGKQYVAVPSGYGGWVGWATVGKGGGGAPQLKDSRKGSTVFVFGLFDE